MPRIPVIDISAYGNILINSSERLETFQETLENWQSRIHIDMKIRIRGTYANDAAKYCKKFNNIAVEIGSDFIQWRNQALFDVRTVNSKYVMIFLEDHQLISNIVTFNHIIDVLKSEKVDIFQYSWFSHHKKMREDILDSTKQNDSEVLTLLLNSKNHKKFIDNNAAYIISLTSIFKKQLLIRLLESRRPYFRKYDSRGPFDVEKSPKSKFYLPIMYAIPTHEFGLCVDDDMGILGSSGISRGVSNSPRTNRGISHYSKLSPKFWISKIRTINPNFSPKNENSQKSTFKSVFSFILNIVNIFTNTLEFIFFEIIDSTRKGFKN